MIVDTLRNASRTRGLRRGIDRALDFLSTSALDALELGKHEIDGERLYALVQQYSPRDPASSKFESHRRYIDVQYLQLGRELIYWAPTARFAKAGPYLEANDAILYADTLSELPSTPVRLEGGLFSIFFPEDAHMPGCRWEGGPSAEVRKIVLKVLLDQS